MDLVSFWSWSAEERQKDVGGLMRFQDTCGPRHKQSKTKQNKEKKKLTGGEFQVFNLCGVVIKAIDTTWFISAPGCCNDNR